MIPDAYWMDDFPSVPEGWVIDGLVCPYITVLSGQPKVRKSTLATHIALAVINQTDFLGRQVNTKSNKVAWIGFDGGWHSEIITRCDGNANNSILFQPGFTSLTQADWNAFGERLIQNQIGLLIVDNLYGFGDLQLNDHYEAKKVFNCLNQIVHNFGIPVLLIAHSPKGGGSAGAAHSNIIKALARVLYGVSQGDEFVKRGLHLARQRITNGVGKVALEAAQLVHL
jgi:RecA-family ATPase